MKTYTLLLLSILFISSISHFGRRPHFGSFFRQNHRHPHGFFRNNHITHTYQSQPSNQVITPTQNLQSEMKKDFQMMRNFIQNQIQKNVEHSIYYPTMRTWNAINMDDQFNLMKVGNNPTNFQFNFQQVQMPVKIQTSQNTKINLQDNDQSDISSTSLSIQDDLNTQKDNTNQQIITAQIYLPLQTDNVIQFKIQSNNQELTPNKKQLRQNQPTKELKDTIIEKLVENVIPLETNSIKQTKILDTIVEKLTEQSIPLQSKQNQNKFIDSFNKLVEEVAPIEAKENTLPNNFLNTIVQKISENTVPVQSKDKPVSQNKFIDNIAEKVSEKKDVIQANDNLNGQPNKQEFNKELIINAIINKFANQKLQEQPDKTQKVQKTLKEK